MPNEPLALARQPPDADTEVLLAALGQLEARLRADASAVERLRDELRMLLIAIRLSRPDIDTASAPAKAGKLAGLLDLLERRIEAIAAPPDVRGAQSIADQAPAEPPPSHLAVVRPSDEPELPIPSPAGAQPPAMTLVGPATIMPEVTLFESEPPKPAVVETTTATPAPVQNIEAARSAAKTPPPPAGPLAPLMALSEDERIALFT